jgi:hypothetical protein
MLGKIGSLVARVAEEAGSVVGLRFGTEEPCYTSEKVTHGLAIRNYGPRYRRRDDIFGGNRQRQDRDDGPGRR